jgi:DNA polymerase I
VPIAPAPIFPQNERMRMDDLERIFKMPVKGFDVETTGLRLYLDAKVFSYCIADISGRVDVYRIDGKDKATNAERKRRTDILKRFWADSSIAKAGHNIQFDYDAVKAMGIEVPDNTVLIDTMIMAIILRNNEVKFGIDYLAWKYARFHCKEDKLVEIQAKERGDRDRNNKILKRFDRVDLDLMNRYQIADGQRTMLLLHMMRDHIARNPKFLKEFSVEMQLLPVTERMMRHGIMFNNKEANALGLDLQRGAAEAMVTVAKAGAPDINLNSPKQVATFLYDFLKLPIQSYTDGGERSVDKNSLLALRETTKNPVLDAVLKNRSYVKAYGMLESYIDNKDSNGMIHPNINTNGARATGRQSCDNPNLQNVSKEASIKSPFAVPLRRAFRAEPMRVMLFCDYSGIEMRLIVDITKEPELMQVLKENGDVHHPTMECFMMEANGHPAKFSYKGDPIFQNGIHRAKELRAQDPKQYKVNRDAYKNTGFGVAYGASPGKVAVTLGKPLAEIVYGDANYRRRFPRVANFSRSLIELVKRQGYIETAFGRRLYVPRDMAYVASNYIIQGTAAGILKRAQIRVDKFLRDNFGDKFIMVLCIHDELVFSVSRDLLHDLPSICKELRRIMCHFDEIETPLDIEFKMSTTSWDRATKRKDL